MAKWAFFAGKDNIGTDLLDAGHSILGTIMDEDRFHIARVWNDAPNAESNARLIAAAPDLYDAAENALKALIGCCVPAGGVDDRKAILDAQQMLRAAIAKATGEA